MTAALATLAAGTTAAAVVAVAEQPASTPQLAKAAAQLAVPARDLFSPMAQPRTPRAIRAAPAKPQAPPAANSAPVPTTVPPITMPSPSHHPMPPGPPTLGWGDD